MKKIKVEEIDLFYLTPEDESSLMDNRKVNDLYPDLSPVSFAPTKLFGCFLPIYDN